MAITVNDLKERLEAVEIDLVNCNYGQARQRLLNVIGILERFGIAIHVVATKDSKEAESNVGEEN